MVMVILRASLRPGVEDEFDAIVAAAHDIALATHGFISFDRYASTRSEQAMLLEFESHEALAAWRDHPDNTATQTADRDRLFTAYRIQVCDVVRGYEFLSEGE